MQRKATILLLAAEVLFAVGLAPALAQKQTLRMAHWAGQPSDGADPRGLDQDDRGGIRRQSNRCCYGSAREAGGSIRPD